MATSLLACHKNKKSDNFITQHFSVRTGKAATSPTLDTLYFIFRRTEILNPYNSADVSLHTLAFGEF